MTPRSSTRLILPEFVGGCIVTEKFKPKATVSSTIEKGIVVHPCATERGKIICDTRFTSASLGPKESFFDFSVIDTILEAYRDRFQSERSSVSLGIARVKWRGKPISIFRNGRIRIRRAVNKQDAEKTLGFLASLLWGSIICDNCGNAAILCASGNCENCGIWSRPEYVLEKSLFHVELLLQGYRHLVSALKEMLKIYRQKGAIESEELVHRTNPEVESAKERKIIASLNGAIRSALDFIVETPQKVDAMFGLTLLGLGSNLRRLHRAQTLSSRTALGKRSLAWISEICCLVLMSTEGGIAAYTEGNVEMGRRAVRIRRRLLKTLEMPPNNIRNLPRNKKLIIEELIRASNAVADTGFRLAQVMGC